MQSTAHHQLLDAVREYKMPVEASELLSAHKPLILCGVTAAGKDTIMRHIEEISEWRHVITHTTRMPRPSEENGKNYWFSTEIEMLDLLSNKEMIEAKAVHGTTVYGTSLTSFRKVLSENCKPILRIDFQGVLEVANGVPDLQAMFILPPSFEVWMERLEKRGHMSHIEKTQRLRSAQMELKEALRSRHFIFVVNREFPHTSNEILKGVTDGPTQHRNREIAQQLIDHVAHF